MAAFGVSSASAFDPKEAFGLKRFWTLVVVALSVFWAAKAASQWCGQPQNIADAILALDACLEQNQKRDIQEMDRDEMVENHFDYGLSMRNEWGLGRESDLFKQFEANGIFIPDDMSSLLLDLYWKHLHGWPLDLEESVGKLKDDYLKLAAKINRNRSRVVIDDSKNLVPLPDPANVKDKVIQLN